jgi:hypothetical protein
LGIINQWNSFYEVAGTSCMKGEITGGWIREGNDPTKLAIYFQGGGGCFNTFTCASGGHPPTGGDPGFDPGYDGILDPNNPQNPLKDYNIVWLPYCSGDAFFGNQAGIKVPGVLGLKTFYGRVNLNLIMQKLVPTFPAVTELFVTGESAGGFGTLASFDFIMQGWPGITQSTLMDDSGPLLADQYLTPCLQTLWRDLWGLTASIPPDCPECTQPDGGGMINIYPFLQNKYPNTKFGFIDSENDGVISFFFGYGLEDCTYRGKLPTFMEGLQKMTSNSTIMYPNRWAQWITSGDKHTFTTFPEFYTDTTQGVSLCSWYQDVINGGVQIVRPWV